MIALIQRVKQAKVQIDDECVGEIGKGILVLLGVEADDQQSTVARLLNKVAGYRMFPDHAGKMNLNVTQVGGELLVVSQFTLAADTKKGMRPGFSGAAEPELAMRLYEQFVEQAKQLGINTQTGRFAADMQVSLQNDGPVTFWLQV